MISIIIPLTANENNVDLLLDRLVEQTGSFEVILVSREAKNPLGSLAGYGAQVINHLGTRGELLNAGAAAAKGQVLLFLWPDTRLPDGALEAIERNLRLLPQTVGGNFHVKFEHNSFTTRWLARHLKRERYQRRYYGNSAIFVRKIDFEAMGGFKPYEILEDYEFASRMEQHGPTLYLPEAVVASTRKFERRKLRAALVWMVIKSLYALGVHPNKLAWLWPR